jgi:hypothetical protein
MGGRNLFMALRPVGKDRCSHTSVSLTEDFLRSAKLRRSLAHQIKHSYLVNGLTKGCVMGANRSAELLLRMEPCNTSGPV